MPMMIMLVLHIKDRQTAAETAPKWLAEKMAKLSQPLMDENE